MFTAKLLLVESGWRASKLRLPSQHTTMRRLMSRSSGLAGKLASKVTINSNLLSSFLSYKGSSSPQVLETVLHSSIVCLPLLTFAQFFTAVLFCFLSIF